MKKRTMWFIAAALAVSAVLLSAGGAEAAPKYYASRGSNYPMEVAGAVYEAEQQQFEDGYFARITRTENGETKVLVPKAEFAYVTNGVYLYYAKPGRRDGESDYDYTNTIYRLTIKTGGKKKIDKGLRFIPVHAVGNYVYYGQDDYADGIQLYSRNVKTRTKNFMVDVVGSVLIGKNRVITDTNSGDVGNYPIWSFKFDGTGKKKITDGILLKVSGRKMYFAKVKFDSNYTPRFRVYSCNLLGKGKTAKTKWVKRIPEIYIS